MRSVVWDVVRKVDRRPRDVVCGPLGYGGERATKHFKAERKISRLGLQNNVQSCIYFRYILGEI